jgi:hypothetical protein
MTPECNGHVVGVSRVKHQVFWVAIGAIGLAGITLALRSLTTGFPDWTYYSFPLGAIALMGFVAWRNRPNGARPS